MRRGGLKRRLLTSSEEEGAARPSSSSGHARVAESARGLGGGARSSLRVGVSHAWSGAPESAERRERGGIRTRLAEPVPDPGLDPGVRLPGTAARLPLNATLKKDWGSGKTSSVNILEIARGARAQGAIGFDTIRSNHAHNAQRALIVFFLATR